MSLTITHYIQEHRSVKMKVTFALKHRLTDSALDNLLELMSCHVKDFPKTTKYHLYKKFNCADLSSMVLHFFCKICQSYICPENDNVDSCPECGEGFNKELNKKAGHFFIQLPLKKQELLEKEAVLDSIQKNVHTRSREIGDVTSGKLYQKVRNSTQFGQNGISLQWNSDGV